LSAFLVLAVVVAGGLGAVGRFLVDAVVRSWTRAPNPLGTVVVNVTGSFALGVVTGLVLAGSVPEAARLVVGTGFLGGYTTFSTASFHTVRVAERGRLGGAVVYGVGTLAATIGAAAVGLWLGLLA
jgi:CrcB protein